jgi:hypothetical protein
MCMRHAGMHKVSCTWCVAHLSCTCCVAHLSCTCCVDFVMSTQSRRGASLCPNPIPVRLLHEPTSAHARETSAWLRGVCSALLSRCVGGCGQRRRRWWRRGRLRRAKAVQEDGCDDHRETLQEAEARHGQIMQIGRADRESRWGSRADGMPARSQGSARWRTRCNRWRT